MRLVRGGWATPVGVSLAAVMAGLVPALRPGDAREKGKSASGAVLEAVVAAPAVLTAAAPEAGPNGFSPQLRLGFHAGDQWEPAIAADDYGSVYVLYPQYGGVPGCPPPECASPTAIVQVSRDRGATWESPHPAAPSGTEQVDTQIVVDPVDGRTLFAAWLQNRKSDIVVARSMDLGNSWSTVVADHTNAGTDKPILAVRGRDVYVAYNHTQTVLVSSSHDGGVTFTSAKVNANAKLGWSLAGGGTVTPDGSVYFAWAGYAQNGQAKGPVNLFISKSADGGATWTNRVLDVSASPPDCSQYVCGWAYLGAQLTLASDEAGTLYALWNAGTVDKGPERIYFARSEDGGVTWSARVDVSRAPAGAAHAFPAIAAGTAGDIRISWMDARNGPLWNVYYRRSSDGGRRFTSEADLSTYVAGFGYIQPAGFSFPFGDYYEVAIDDRGDSHLIWGEGLNWDSPGSIWYARGR
jgi:BNR repeat protein